MKLSTRSKYGLRFMLELAGKYTQGPLFLKDIAHTQEISEKYLSQIVIDLKAARLVDGFRGAHGGYVLAKSPAEITVYDIVNLFDGDFATVECANNSESCKKILQCVAQEVWQELGRVMTQTLEAITLQDLLERQREKAQEFAMYYI